jgi:uncharacterized membrane protein (DUF4010 family)
MDQLILLQKILLTLAIGALIGLERERRKARERVFAGVRTFMFVCLLGLMTSYLSELFQSYVPVYIGLLTVCAIAVVSYGVSYARRKTGLTTRMALIISYIIGVIVFWESYPYIISILLGIVVTLFLLSKESIHKFASKLKSSEIRDATIFAIVAFIILPLLPNASMGPGGTINPYTVWLVVVIILGIGFFAYVAMKILGPKHGLFLAGLFGGFASSTNLTVVMAEDARKHSRILYSSSFAVLIASSIMFFRQIAIALAFNLALSEVIIPFSLIGWLGISLSLLVWRKAVREKAVISIGSPLKLKSALTFLVYLLMVLSLVGFVKDYWGYSAMYTVSFLSGLVDVDAITISLAAMSATGMSFSVAIRSMLLAATANTVSKWLLTRMIARNMERELRRYFTVLTVACLAMLFLLV